LFAIIHLENGLLKDKRLGIRELKVFIALAGHADKETRKCWPSRKRISELTGIHVSNVSVATRKLKKFGYIEKEEFFGRVNRYRILEPLVNSTPVSDKLRVSKQLLPPSQNDTGVLSKTTTRNIPITKQEHTKNRFWADISFSKFKEIKNRPEYSKEFDEIWKFYQRACSSNNSTEGNKLAAWFYYLKLTERDISENRIMIATKVCIEKKQKADEKLAHFSTFLNQPELIDQYFNEKEERQSKSSSAKLSGFENRF